MDWEDCNNYPDSPENPMVDILLIGGVLLGSAIVALPFYFPNTFPDPLGTLAAAVL